MSQEEIRFLAAATSQTKIQAASAPAPEDGAHPVSLKSAGDTRFDLLSWMLIVALTVVIAGVVWFSVWLGESS